MCERAGLYIIHGPARVCYTGQPVRNGPSVAHSPHPLSPSLRPVLARHGPMGWPWPVGSLLLIPKTIENMLGFHKQ